jgi:Flp pilus assembly protein TadD
VTVWDAASGDRLVGPLRHAEWCKASFDRDGGRILTASGDGTARLWDARTGAPLTPPLEHRGPVSTASLSPDGRFVVTASDTARVWDAATGEAVTPGYRHEGAVSGAVFLSDRRIATASSADGIVRVWNLPVQESSTAMLEELARLTSGRTFQSAGALVAVEPEELHRSWTKLRKDHPELLAVSPAKVAGWHRRLAEALAGERRWVEALARLNTLVQSPPARWSDRLARGRVYAGLGRWPEAAADFSQAFQMRPDDAETAHAYALVALSRGDRDEYRRVRSWLLQKYGHTRNPERAAFIVRTAVLAPADTGEAGALVLALARTAQEIQPDEPEGVEFLAAAFIRAGRIDQADEALRKAAIGREGGSVRADLLAALAGLRRRSPASMRPPRSRTWREELEIQVLRAEVGGERRK